VSPHRFNPILLVVVAAVVAVGTPAQTETNSARLLFTGDILLSRHVISELERRKVSPWANFADLFQNAEWVSGNLEGAIGQASECQKPAPLCFVIPETAIGLLKNAGFTGVTLENNHAGDLGGTGRERTRRSLEEARLTAVNFENSPRIVRIAGKRLALVSITLVRAADKRVEEIPSTEVSEKLRLARVDADLVVVSIHWGTEYQRSPDKSQRAQAHWLIQHGADLIVGHHPHVVQPPECVDGHPVFFSLGNHLFDQTYPPTKDGLIADCSLGGGWLMCQGIRTHTENWSTIPRLAEADPGTRAALAGCTPATKKPIHHDTGRD
jgi:poly-gamma-glutamate capsule biosynthesis protein CapA/YwtB (metallophosphatase superfamily)